MIQSNDASAIIKTPCELSPQIGQYKIFMVDGDAVRKLSIDFTQGGHSLVFPFIPDDEIWIEDMKNPKEHAFIIAHEVLERHVMGGIKMDYEHAHELSNQVEVMLRTALNQ